MPAAPPAPLDHPTPDRPHRLYLALTNHCNRSCPWCSTCSSPRGNTWLEPDGFEHAVPREGAFQVQLEGGEPTLHPRFWEFVARARAHPRCTRLVLCTNGVLLPREPERLRAWVARLGAPLTLKLSINHHLLDHDPGLLEFARTLRDLLSASAPPGGDRLLLLNVRLRRGIDDDDRRVREAVERAGLAALANVFFLQRYGFAADRPEWAGWDLPAVVSDRFSMVNPDGTVYGPELLARSEGMRRLP